MSKVKKTCTLCNTESKLVKTECCSVWLCTGREDNIPNAGPNSTNCDANHNQFTLCAFHHTQKHKDQDWRKCEKCKDAFQPEIYIHLGTNQYNHVKLEETMTIESTPIPCKDCNKVIKVDEQGSYVQKADGSISCQQCENRMIPEIRVTPPVQTNNLSPKQKQSPSKSVNLSPKKPKSPIASRPATPSKCESKPRKQKYKGLTSMQIIQALQNEIVHKFGRASTSTSRSAKEEPTPRTRRPKSMDAQSVNKTKRPPRARSMSRDSSKKEVNPSMQNDFASFMGLQVERKPSNLRPYSLYQKSTSGKKKLKSSAVKSNKRVSFNLVPQPPWQPASQPVLLPSAKKEAHRDETKNKRKADKIMEKSKSPTNSGKNSLESKKKRVKKNDEALDPHNDQKVTIVLKKKTPSKEKSPSAEGNPSNTSSADKTGSGSKKKVQGITKKMNVEENKPVVIA